MKNVLTSLTAIMLVVWYSLSVIGFDVHTCRGSGETYIATVASGFSCEEIHPETHPAVGHSADADRLSFHTDTEPHAHTGCSCCHSHESETAQLDTKPCCSDDFQVIVLTGVRSGQDSKDHSFHASMLCHAVLDFPSQDSNAYYSGFRTFYKPRSGDIVPRDVMVSYNIWRI